jgi:hypothetical protein
MATTARVIALAQKYRCRPLPAASKPKKLQKAAKQSVLPPLKTVQSLAEYNIVGARFNPTELVVEGGLSESEWLSIGRALTHVESSSKWWIGDWVNAGMKAFGKGVAYSLAVQATAQERHSLYHTAWTASKFEPHRRIAALSFSHHQAVAALPADVADRLLKEALELGLTAEQIYQAGREECGKKREYNLQKVGVYLSDETLGIVQNLARVKKGKRLAWFLSNIVCEWLVEHGHRPPKKSANEIFKERQAAGLCGFCGKNVPEQGKKTCEICLARARTYDHFRRHEKQELPQLGE